MKLYLFLAFLMTFSLSALPVTALENHDTFQRLSLSHDERCSRSKSCIFLADSQNPSSSKTLKPNLTPCQARCAESHGNPFSCFCPY